MKIKGRPVRTTVLFGLLAAVAFIPATLTLNLFLPWSQTFCLVLWFFVAFYGFLLARWTGTGLLGIFFPVVLLFLFALLGHSIFGFLLLAMGILSWMRSGVCFPRPWGRSLATELLISLGGGALAIAFFPNSPASWALGIWMFFLIQSLYFFLSGNTGEEEKDRAEEDPFEQARMRVERILSNSP